MLKKIRRWLRRSGDQEALDGDPVVRGSERAHKLFGDPPTIDTAPYPPAKSMPGVDLRPQPAFKPKRKTWPIIVLGSAVGTIAGLLLWADDPTAIVATPWAMLNDPKASTRYFECTRMHYFGPAPLHQAKSVKPKPIDIANGIGCGSIVDTIIKHRRADTVRRKPL